MTSPGKRRDMDIMKLMMANHPVEIMDEVNSNGRTGFRVKFHGPNESYYEGGVWTVHVDLPVDYPFRSPSIGFANRIYHPNIDFQSGSVCLDVINQTWSPMFDLVNVFEVFLPQLLKYPNPSDPLNGEAASLLLRDEKKFSVRVKEMVATYASPSKDDSFGGGVAHSYPTKKSGSSLVSSSLSSSSTMASMMNSPSPASCNSGSPSLMPSIKNHTVSNIGYRNNYNDEDLVSDSENVDDEEEDLAADMEL